MMRACGCAIAAGILGCIGSLFAKVSGRAVDVTMNYVVQHLIGISCYGALLAANVFGMALTVVSLSSLSSLQATVLSLTANLVATVTLQPLFSDFQATFNCPPFRRVFHGLRPGTCGQVPVQRAARIPVGRGRVRPSGRSLLDFEGYGSVRQRGKGPLAASQVSMMRGGVWRVCNNSADSDISFASSCNGGQLCGGELRDTEGLDGHRPNGSNPITRREADGQESGGQCRALEVVEQEGIAAGFGIYNYKAVVAYDGTHFQV
jgi:hypothetical protein